MTPAFGTGLAMRTFCLSAVAWLALAAGCQRGSEGGWELKRWDRPQGQQGEPWTILCLEATGAEACKSLDILADGLRQTPGLKRDAVRLVRQADSSRLYYGAYYRYWDSDSGRWRMPPELRRDMSCIRQLAAGQNFPFLHCTPVPQETAELGPPEWDLRRADGEYTLLVAVYSEMEHRRQAAVEHVKLLRDQGEEAYFYHHMGKSHVSVGSFPASVLRDTARGLPRVDHPDYAAAKRRHPDFIYNGQYISNVNRDAAGQVISKTRQPTRLVRIPRNQSEEL